MGEPRVIKRYSNRKLYDTQLSRYVTLDQIADLVRAGEDVKIVDNNSKDDLTSVTLAQIIYEEEKKQRSFLPLQAMRNIIQSGGERIEELVTQAQRRVSGVFSRRPLSPGAAAAGGIPVAEGPAVEEPDADTSPGKVAARPLREFREWLLATQRTIDDWQRQIDDRIRHALEGISPFSSLQREVAVLAARIEELEQKLEEVAGAEAAALAAARDEVDPAETVAGEGADGRAAGEPPTSRS